VLAFVTSLPHPANCASYPARSALLADTLGSILGQQDRDIHVVVVANEPPACLLPDDSRLEVVLVRYPPSASTPGKPSLVGIETDKGAKLGIGTSVATARGSDHVMWVDSDDYIHRDIAGTVAASPQVPGWYFDAGFYHIRGERRVTRVVHEFHQRNGSSHVLRTDVVAIPADLDPGMSRDDVLDAIGRNKATQIMGRHRPIVEFFENQGIALEPFPFPAAIWEIGTGENCTGVFAASGRKEPIAGRIAEEFGIAVPSRVSAAQAVLSVFGARVSRHLGRGS